MRIKWGSESEGRKVPVTNPTLTLELSWTFLFFFSFLLHAGSTNRVCIHYFWFLKLTKLAGCLLLWHPLDSLLKYTSHLLMSVVFCNRPKLDLNYFSRAGPTWALLTAISSTSSTPPVHPVTGASCCLLPLQSWEGGWALFINECCEGHWEYTRWIQALTDICFYFNSCVFLWLTYTY